jgi:hypothetical protein
MDMVHGELSLADQFARLKVKFKKYVGSTVFVSLQFFFFSMLVTELLCSDATI